VDGAVLRQWRRSRGWDVPEMARRLRVAAGGSALPEPDSLRRMVWRWEREGLRNERYELLYARALRIPPDDLAGSAVGPRVSSLLPAGGGEDGDDPVKRREFGMATLGALAGIVVPSAGVEGPVSIEHVGALRRVVAELWSRDREVGGSALLTEAKGYYSTVRGWLDTGTYTTAVGADLVAVAAELAACAGFIAFDASDQVKARSLLTESLILSGSTPHLAAHACALLAMQSSSLSSATGRVGLARESLRLLDQVSQVARHEPSAKLHAVVAMRRSLAAALLGDGQGARRHLDGAWRELDRGDHPSDPACFAFVTPTEVTAHEATAAVHLGQAERAAGIYRDVLSAESLSARNRVFYSARLAGALEAAGDHRGAVGTGLGVLDDLEGAIRSGRTLNLLKPVRARTGRGDEFAARYDALVTA
jgi:transcriptional regulator with XRE-family HTH domain